MVEEKQKDNTSSGREFWGPPIWTTIHILASTLRPENASEFKRFLETLTHLLPCERCKQNLKTKLKMYPPDKYLLNNDDAFFYTYLLHDAVNENITKTNPKTPKESPNFDNIKSFYFKGLYQECKDCQLQNTI